MLFKFCSDYFVDFKDRIYKKENKEFQCFICFENILIINNPKKKLQQIIKNKFINKCKCDGNLHVNCFEIWYKFSQKCPICREKLIIKKNTKEINYFCIIIKIFYHFYLLILYFSFFYYYYHLGNKYSFKKYKL